MSDSETPGPGGVPASSGSPIADLVAAGPPLPEIRTALSEMLDEAFEVPRPPHRTKVERWVEDAPGPFGARGHWEPVE